MKLIIFDLDGTLIDSLPDITWALNQALADFGGPSYDRSQVERFIGSGTDKLLERATNGQVPTGLKAKYQAYYDANLMTRTTVYPGIYDLLDQLAPTSLAVISNKYHSAVVEIVNHFFPDRFAAVLGEGPYPRKPDPGAINALRRQFGASASETVLVGDSRVDQATAQAAGIFFIPVNWGYDILSESVNLDQLADHL